MLDIESSGFSWSNLSSLHHAEHGSSAEHSEDEINKAFEVTVNSGGVVFFALFNIPENDSVLQKEAAAVIKISPSRMVTQSERLGYELAKWLGVQTPKARVVHNSSLEWQQINDAAEKARDVAILEGDEIGETACSELLEALEMSKCLLLMNYIRGFPLQDSHNAFDSQEAASKTAAALGRILMLDLVIRNEDRLPCRQLGWRGNHANMLFVDKAASGNLDASERTHSPVRRDRPRAIRTLQKQRQCISGEIRVEPQKTKVMSKSGYASNAMSLPIATQTASKLYEGLSDSKLNNFNIVVIDSGVPRLPPSGKRANDHTHYPKFVELLLNSFEFSSYLLHEITCGKMISPSENISSQMSNYSYDTTTIVNEFRGGFRSALIDLQGFYVFLLTLHQKLENHLRTFESIINKYSSDFEKEDAASESLSQMLGGSLSFTSTLSKDQEGLADLSDSELLKTSLKSSHSVQETMDSSSPSRESWHGRFSKWKRLTIKLRDLNKFAKVDADLNKELEQWNEMLRMDVVKLCQDNDFNTGFFECGDNSLVVDAYELKVRLEHILERISMILDAANTERPSMITDYLFIGGALAARSVFTLQHLGITHVLCLCSNEIGQSDSQFPDLFEYKNFSILDTDDAKISDFFEEASDFIEHAENSGRRVLVHCFEGKSRSATVVLAYLMLRKHFTLSQAWNTLKGVHHRAHPNDGFAKILLHLDKKLHGKPSMEWQQRKPLMRICPICGKSAGLSTGSLKLHLQKFHRNISSGSVDSAMTMKIQRTLTPASSSVHESISPAQKHKPSVID